ncbi:acetyl-CoA C-acetyltransferase [bacterium]|nr:acetyl-CoA C-acetyltransferase [bacterium]
MSTLNQPEDLVFVAAKRTAFGSYGGTLASFSATDLAVEAAKACLTQSGVKANEIDSIIVGNVVQSSSDAIYLARHVGLKIGMPEDRPALVVNRLCGSGFEAIAQGAYQLMIEGADCVMVGGSESMTQIPYVLRSARFGYRLGNGVAEDYLTASLTDSYTGQPMAITAENLAERYKLSRSQVDEYALRSQQRAAAAWESGCFRDEVCPIEYTKKGKTLVFEKDEHMRPESTLESMSKLPPLFKKEGTVTAATASGICDGASMMILCKRSFAEKKKLPILGKLISWASVGCDPKIMGIGPVPATQKVLERWSTQDGKAHKVSDFALVEINEAFGAQYLSVEKELGLDPEKTNVDGGAIAIGHPLAASGTRLVSHLLYRLKSKGGKFGLASACIGGGQGMSVIVEV